MTMKWCNEHWQALRDSIDDAGLGHLVSQGGEAAAKRIQDEAAGSATDETFDPLLAAWSMIDRAFLYPLSPEQRLRMLAHEAGDCCTLCELGRLNPQNPAIVQNWIGGCTRDVRVYCKNKGLIQEPPR